MKAIMGSFQNRIIKFRAWDKKNKCFSSGNPYRTFDTITNVGIGSNENIELKAIKNFILLQFTGLCDRQGKEIYEKDIVKFNDSSQEIIVIEFPEDFLWMQTQRKQYEIIGNIYENPDLVK